MRSGGVAPAPAGGAGARRRSRRRRRRGPRSSRPRRASVGHAGCRRRPRRAARSRSATIVGGRRSRSAQRWRSRAQGDGVEGARPRRVAHAERRSRRRSSPAASRVNVRASVWRASAVPVAMRWAMRRVSTVVLPEPAPAMMATSVDGVVTAAALVGVEAAEQGADGAASRRVRRPAPHRPPYGPPGLSCVACRTRRSC